MRKCDRCKATMEAGRPRVRVGGKQLWCQTCVKDKSAPSGRYKPGSDIAKGSALTSDPDHPDNHLFAPVNHDFPICTKCNFEEHWHPHMHQGDNATRCSTPDCGRDMSHYLHDKGKYEHLMVRDNPVPDDPSSMWRIRSSLSRDQNECDHNGPHNLHGQCMSCGHTAPTEADEPCDNEHCIGFPDGWHTKGEHIDPEHADPHSDLWHYKPEGQGPYDPCTEPGCASLPPHDNLEHVNRELMNPTIKHLHEQVSDAFGGEDHSWLLDRNEKGPTHLSSKTAAWSQARHREPIIHVMGQRPPRPLQTGDRVMHPDSGFTDTVVGHAPSLLMMEKSGIMHRAPIEGDHSKSIIGESIEDHDEARRKLDEVGSDAEREFLKGNPTGPTKWSALTPVVLGITSSLRRTTASDDDFAKHFNDEMKGSEGKALGEHLWDGMSKAFGFEDGEHMLVHRQNRDHEELAKRYEGQPGKLGMDENGEPHYEIHHPSGWIGRMNVGPYMDISHKATPHETHEILDVGQSDSNGHVLHPSMATDDPLVNHHRAHWALHNFVKEHGEEYADNIPKIKSWQGRRGLTNQGARGYAPRGEDPADSTLWWRSPTGEHEVHVKPWMPDRDLRENYGAKPHRDVALHHVDPTNPNQRPSIRRMDSDGSLAPVDQFGGRYPKPPPHVMRHLMDAHDHVQSTADSYADLHGQAEEHKDIASDLARVPRDMEAEQKAHRMFDNLIQKSRDDDDPPTVPRPRSAALVYGSHDEDDEPYCEHCGDWGHGEEAHERTCGLCGNLKRPDGTHPYNGEGENERCPNAPEPIDEKEDRIHDSLHPADYCGPACREGHAADLARGIGTHHIFSPGEPEYDNPRNLPSSVAPHSQDPHSAPGYRHGNGDYEYRDPGKDARCHYCRSPLLDLKKEPFTMPNPRQGTRKIALTVVKTGQRLVVVAHDSGDGETIYHCPFCGSGQVIARSDGTIDCEFCHTMFTVQVQPEYPAFPQTINGMPVQVPGMPGQIDNPVGATPPGGDPNAPMDPSQVGAPTDGDGDGAVDADGDGEDDDFAAPASASNQPPWLKGSSLVTAKGQRLAPEDFVAHLAIKHAPDKAAVIEQVRARRKS